HQSLVAAGFDPFGPTAPPAPPREARTAETVAAERRRLQREDARVERIKELRAQVYESIAHHNLPHAAILFIELKNLDRHQVLSRQAQLDVANQLASQQFHEQAADAYEQFLTHYPNF